MSERRLRVFMMDLLATVPYYTAYLAKALARENVELAVGSIDYYLDPQCFAGRGVRVDPGLLNIVGRFQLPRSARRPLKLAETAVNVAALSLRFAVAPPDVVHVQFLPMLRTRIPLDLWLVKYCRRHGAKIVLTVHDLLPHDTGDTHKATYASLYALADGLICHSDAVKARLVAEFGMAQAKVSVIPHGPFFYDLPPSASDSVLRDFALPAGSRYVLWQGILFPYKGVDLLLDAWQQVEREDGNVWLVIAGTGAPELLEQVRTRAQQLGLKRVALHFRFISTEELVALYRGADIVVYPYRAITTSGALATGLALGKTIVATDLPVFRELLTDGENARLVPPFDTDALGAALIELLQNPALRERLAQAVQTMRFGDESWIAIARKTAGVYETLAGR
jgi:glycosyltransferase involved in cell wall biosynthesis